MTSREAVMAGLEMLLSNAYAWITGPERRLKLWADVPLSQRPALFLFDGGQDRYTYNNSINLKRTINVKLFVYTNSKENTGSIELNEIMDAIDNALAPKDGDLQLGRNTLGGCAYHCRIEGDVVKDPGDLDGEGLLIIPVQILLP
ncbi:hypothetical protein [Beijerinckia indica]|uniref:Uncharacterized protein n=1 Tax=Beijerinckia indica subsp. indica (strain ATCC 9039 / DSM 1715 / NCIMB 8712) TaxID=395963 RepID=B2IFS9_BEII9|nr:hypothetical protein [Beijerinckia indica]ACB94290.1 conserved hypothetical protein [Beijerinckia indica subsp. indica ATCC 9039]